MTDGMDAYVYMLRCAEGSYCVGTTRGELMTRIVRHQAGALDGYTARRRTVTLAFHQKIRPHRRCDRCGAASQRLAPRKEGDADSRRLCGIAGAVPAHGATGDTCFETRYFGALLSMEAL
jgi:hypothetical protein